MSVKQAVKEAYCKYTVHSSTASVVRANTRGLCDCMWVSFDPRERTICGLTTVLGGRGAIVGGASKSCKICTTVAALISILF